MLEREVQGREHQDQGMDPNRFIEWIEFVCQCPKVLLVLEHEPAILILKIGGLIILLGE